MLAYEYCLRLPLVLRLTGVPAMMPLAARPRCGRATEMAALCSRTHVIFRAPLRSSRMISVLVNYLAAKGSRERCGLAHIL
jgi:hypothetical protein